MRQVLAQSWWVLALRGACAVLFGVLALAWPGITLLLLVALFAAYAVISGAAALVGSFRNRNQRGWWLLFLLGLVSLAAGVLAVVYPGITALALVLLMGANAIVTGVLELWMAVRLRAELRGEWLLGLAGVVSILFGAFVMIFPGAGALALVWLIAIQAIASGILWLALAFRIRAAEPDRRHKTHGAHPA